MYKITYVDTHNRVSLRGAHHRLLQPLSTEVEIAPSHVVQTPTHLLQGDVIERTVGRGGNTPQSVTTRTQNLIKPGEKQHLAKNFRLARLYSEYYLFTSEALKIKTKLLFETNF